MKEQEIYFIDRLTKHIRRVQDNMILLEKNRDKLPFEFEKWHLIRLGMRHDLSKFNKEFINGYIATNEYFRNKRLGLDNGYIHLHELEWVWEQHERLEDHHPEYKTEMSNIALCEMCCDLSAMSQEFKEKDYTKYFKETLCKDVPLVNKYEKECVKILELLQKLFEEQS